VALLEKQASKLAGTVEGFVDLIEDPYFLTWI
jgi:hypothetical protein